MELSPNDPTLLERAGRWLFTQWKTYWIPYVTALLSGLLAYTFFFTNKLPNQDDMIFLFTKGGTIQSGRWGLDLSEFLFPSYSMPWIYGVISMLLLGAFICLTLRIFHIRSRIAQILLAACIMVTPSQIGTMIFIYTAAPYALSLLLAGIAVYLLSLKPWRGIPLAMVCMILSLSIYQSYIAVAASFLVLLLIQQLLNGRPVKAVLKDGVGYLCFLILSLGVYYGLTLIIQSCAGTTFNSYAANHVTFQLSALPAAVRTAYRVFLDIFRESYCLLIPTAFSRLLHWTCLLAAAALFLIWWWIQGKKDPARTGLILLLLLLLPLAVNCMYLFSTENAVHTLVLYAFIAMYVLFALICEKCGSILSLPRFGKLVKRVSTELITLCLACIIAVNIYLANETYLALYLRYENAYAFYTSLIADIKMMPEFDENTKLAVIGNYQHPAVYEDHFDFTYGMFGANGFRPDSDSKWHFLLNYIGFEIPMVLDYEPEYQALRSSEEFAQMPVYPYYGSLKKIGDTLVVKLS